MSSQSPVEGDHRTEPDERPSVFKTVALVVCSQLLLAAVLYGMSTQQPARSSAREAPQPTIAATAGVAAIESTPVPATPLPTTSPSATATPFQLIPSPVRATAVFTLEPGHACPGMPGSLRDVLVFSTASGLLTIRQPSTGGVSTGPIDASGAFTVKGQVVHETYSGQISGLSATAENALEVGGCTALYRVAAHFMTTG